MRLRVRAGWVVACVASCVGIAFAGERPDGSPIAVANAPAAVVSEPGPERQPSRPQPSRPQPSRPQPLAPTDASRNDGADSAVTIVLGGDLGLGGSNEAVHAGGASRHGKRHAWRELTAGIAPLIDGDLNFANLETVVTDRNDLRANPKAFNFRSHPAGVRHLVDLGFNVFSTANNHALDYGEAGVRETVRHLQALESHGLGAWPGIGLGRELASRPGDVMAKGARVRVSSIGIGGNGIPPQSSGHGGPRAGMLSYHRPEDFRETLARLADAEGDLRILSVHYGAEMQVRPGYGDVAKLRDEAARGAGIDIVVGHHAHVPAGVQIVDGKLILYGLGNLLHPGMQDMARFDVCRDYGLMVRVHMSRAAGGRLELRAIESIPITGMHARAEPLSGAEGRMRVEVLNHLASGLDAAEVGATGVRFTPRPDGSGLHCRPGADQEPGTIGALCRGWEPPPPPSAAASRRIAGACGGVLVARRRGGRDAATNAGPGRARVLRRTVQQAQKGGSLLSSIFGGW